MFSFCKTPCGGRVVRQVFSFQKSMVIRNYLCLLAHDEVTAEGFFINWNFN